MKGRLDTPDTSAGRRGETLERGMEMVVAECSPSSTKPLTERQENILGLICTHIRDHGMPPSIRELGLYKGITSPNGIRFHLRALEKKGYLRLYEKLKSRTLKVLKAPRGWLLVKGLLIRELEGREMILSLYKALQQRKVENAIQEESVSAGAE